MRGRRGAGAGSGAGTHPSLTSPHPRVAACRLQEEMLQREEAESTLQSFRQVGAAAAGRWGRKVGAGLGWAGGWLCPHKGRSAQPLVLPVVFFRGVPQSGGEGEAIVPLYPGLAGSTKALRRGIAF